MNEQNENIMNEEVIEDTNVTTEETGMGNGVAMLIGSGLTLAVIAAVRFGKKAYDKFKAEKERKKDIEALNEDENVVDAEFEEVESEEE